MRDFLIKTQLCYTSDGKDSSPTGSNCQSLCIDPVTNALPDVCSSPLAKGVCNLDEIDYTIALQKFPLFETYECK